jgi:hypothetical protein
MVAVMVAVVISAAAMVVVAATSKHYGNARIHDTGVMER